MEVTVVQGEIHKAGNPRSFLGRSRIVFKPMDVILEIKSDNETCPFVDRVKLSAIFCKYNAAGSPCAVLRLITDADIIVPLIEGITL